MNKTGLFRLWELTGKRKILIVCSGFFAIISALISFVPFISVFYIIKSILSTGLSNVDYNFVKMMGIVAFSGVVGSIFTNFIALMFSHYAAFGIQYDLKLGFIKHISELSLGFHTANSTGKMRKIVDENIEKLEGFVAHSVPDLIGSSAAPLIMAVLLFVFDWRFGLAAVIPIFVAFFIQYKAFFNKKNFEMVKYYQDALEDMNAGAVEYVRGISVVKAFNQTIFSFKKFHKSIRDFTTFIIDWTLSYKKPYVVYFTIISHVYLFLLPAGVLIQAVTPDYKAFALSFMFYLIFAPSIDALLSKIMYLASNTKLIGDSIDRMDNILHEKPLPEKIHSYTVADYSVEFSDVTFSYNKGVEVLSNISFTAKQGEITALVGASGSGKSTIAHLIPRFWDVSSGSISIGGVNIKDIEHNDLMQMMSFVFQDVFLFKQSVFDNIRIGKPDATDDMVIEAAKDAQCHDFIMKLPKGYDTIVGTEGIHLSGGERQRLAIARAIIKNAPIVVLDEATAFADPENEYLIQQAFISLLKDKTAIIIAHRLSTIQNASQIIVLDKGRIVEYGTHGELIALNGRYENMWSIYNKTLAWKFEKDAVEISHA